MELIENLLQLLTTFVGALLSGISYRKSGRQAYFLLLCFYGCFALGALYWTLYLLLFDTTPRVFYVSEFGWVASVIFLRILQATLATQDERSFRCRRAWLAPAFGVPLLAFYCIFGDILSNLIWCGMMIWLSFCAIRGAFARAVGAKQPIYPRRKGQVDAPQGFLCTVSLGDFVKLQLHPVTPLPRRFHSARHRNSPWR